MEVCIGGKSCVCQPYIESAITLSDKCFFSTCSKTTIEEIFNLRLREMKVSMFSYFLHYLEGTLPQQIC